jgi:hypothetical protein
VLNWARWAPSLAMRSGTHLTRSRCTSTPHSAVEQRCGSRIYAERTMRSRSIQQHELHSESRAVGCGLHPFPHQSMSTSRAARHWERTSLGCSRRYTGYRAALDERPHRPGVLTAFAQLRCSHVNDYHLWNRLNTDTHAPSAARIHNVLMIFKPFAAAYQCPTGSPMNPTVQRNLCI